MTASPLYRLLYRSRHTTAVPGALDREVEEIIGGSIPRNRSVGLTGLLLVIRGHFVQALEGPEDEVRTTYARISRDRRHGDLHIISQGFAAERLFGEWNMCAASLAETDKAILQVLDSKAQFNPRALTPQSTQRLLTTVAEIQRRNNAVALAS